MAAGRYFSRDYGEARSKFLAAAEAAGATLHSYENPNRGPAGEALATDTAWLGPRDASTVLVTISATHGAEGFCGSGVQVGWFESGLAAEAPDDTALLQIHAINPYGFAWLRRVTEDNVDLNRNFVDHSAPHPTNPGYLDVAEVLCPTDWNDAVIAETEQALNAYAETHGAQALQSAISGGQYSHPDGLFFGGHRDTWSKQTLLRIADDFLGRARRVALIDYHTGLGPRGYGERICCHQPDSASLARANRWWHEDLTSPSLGTSSSVELFGVSLLGLEARLDQAEFTAVALEFGTLDTRDVRRALRADNWLHLHGDPSSAKGRAIKEQVRDAFYQDQEDWKDMIWERSLETQRLALGALAERP